VLRRELRKRKHKGTRKIRVLKNEENEKMEITEEFNKRRISEGKDLQRQNIRPKTVRISKKRAPLRKRSHKMWTFGEKINQHGKAKKTVWQTSVTRAWGLDRRKQACDWGKYKRVNTTKLIEEASKKSCVEHIRDDQYCWGIVRANIEWKTQWVL